MFKYLFRFLIVLKHLFWLMLFSGGHSSALLERAVILRLLQVTFRFRWFKKDKYPHRTKINLPLNYWVLLRVGYYSIHLQ